MFTAEKEPESMHKEFDGIVHELAWMPQGTFASFSGGSGTHYSYSGEDKVWFHLTDFNIHDVVSVQHLFTCVGK